MPEYRYYYRKLNVPYTATCKSCLTSKLCKHLAFARIDSAGYPYCDECVVKDLGLHILGEVKLEDVKVKEVITPRTRLKNIDGPNIKRCKQCKCRLEGRIEVEMAEKHDGLCGVCFTQ